MNAQRWCYVTAGIPWCRTDASSVVATLPDGRRATVRRKERGVVWTVGAEAGGARHHSMLRACIDIVLAAKRQAGTR